MQNLGKYPGAACMGVLHGYPGRRVIVRESSSKEPFNPECGCHSRDSLRLPDQTIRHYNAALHRLGSRRFARRRPRIHCGRLAGDRDGERSDGRWNVKARRFAALRRLSRRICSATGEVEHLHVEATLRTVAGPVRGISN